MTDSGEGSRRSFYGKGFGRQSNFARKPVNQEREDNEIADLFQKTRINAGINFAEYAKIPVRCVPNNIVPAASFTAFGMPDSLRSNVERAGYQQPTPIQQYSQPIIFKGNDLMACAQTGSGKTAAFLMPIISDIFEKGKGCLPIHMRGDPTYASAALPVALVLGPTRELVSQIHDEARKFCYKTEVRSVVCYGGVEKSAQEHELRKGADIVVATPGRLWDLFSMRTLRFMCIRFVVLDEADRMLDLGFDKQIEQIMEDTDMPRTADRQTLMFSATFPSMIQTLAKNYLGNYYFVTVGRVGQTTEGITQRVELVEPENKFRVLNQLLRKDVGALKLVFVETKRTAEQLLDGLYDVFNVDALHGDRSQAEREHALKMFRNGEINILVATDVASRGLDIPNVEHVIQYDLPKSMDDYIHRIGRTGRAGNIGLATALFSPSDCPMASELLQILKEHHQSIPEWLPDMTLQAMQRKSARGKGRSGKSFQRGRNSSY
ncbi:ATP dependent RNA helicase (Dbp1) [Perkinsela sp. CCAP 1560/4]|nr:ATP dependent RNA helicase (Dbp1) [Perkinsela sp. CCAP 1560/4]|eukprot:KNH08994.1 ATP dependent RNA helicase (Dbp1) [Perkinsela sp. CCAP 1560/4]